MDPLGLHARGRSPGFETQAADVLHCVFVPGRSTDLPRQHAGRLPRAHRRSLWPCAQSAQAATGRPRHHSQIPSRSCRSWSRRSSRTSQSRSSGSGRVEKADDWVLLPNVRLTSSARTTSSTSSSSCPASASSSSRSRAAASRSTRRVAGGPVVARAAAGCRPVEQCRDGKYALRDFIEADPRWKDRRSRVRLGHAIVVPFTDVADDFATPDCPRWMISGRGDLEDLAGRVHDVARPAGERPARAER